MCERRGAERQQHSTRVPRCSLFMVPGSLRLAGSMVGCTRSQQAFHCGYPTAWVAGTSPNVCTTTASRCHAQLAGLPRTCTRMHNSRSEQGWPLRLNAYAGWFVCRQPAGDCVLPAKVPCTKGMQMYSLLNSHCHGGCAASGCASSIPCMC